MCMLPKALTKNIFRAYTLVMSFSRAVRAITAAAMLVSVPGPSWASVVEAGIEVPATGNHSPVGAVQATSLAPLAPSAWLGMPSAATGLSAFTAPSALAPSAVPPAAVVPGAASVPTRVALASPVTAATLRPAPAAVLRPASPPDLAPAAALSRLPAAFGNERGAPEARGAAAPSDVPSPEVAAEASRAFFDGSAAAERLGDGGSAATAEPAAGRRGGFLARLGLRAATRSQDPGQPPSGSVPANLPAGFDPGGVMVHLAGLGRETVSVPLARLGAALDADPAFRDALNRNGRVRWVVRRAGEPPAAADAKSSKLGSFLSALRTVDPAEAAQKRDAPALKSYLESFGVQRPVDLESMAALKTEKDAVEAEAAEPAAPTSVLGKIAAEPGWLRRQFRSSVTPPTRDEIVTGVYTRLAFIALNVYFLAPTFLPHHVVAFLMLAGLTVVLKTFHSFWVDSWATFRGRLARLRGMGYLAGFDFLYGQLVAMIYRTISYFSLPNITPFWTVQYWKDMGIMTFIGTIVGTIAAQSLTDLYEKGVISRKGRSTANQVRMLAMDGSGYFFKTGLMHNFWPIFLAQQGLDVLLSLFAWRSKPRAILYISTSELSLAQDYREQYPVQRDAAAKPRLPLSARIKGAIGGHPLAIALRGAWDWARRRTAVLPIFTMLAGNAVGGSTLARSYQDALAGKSMKDAKVLARLPLLTLRLDPKGHPLPATSGGGISVPLLVTDSDGTTGVFKPIRMDAAHPLYPYERMKLLREVVGGSLMRQFGVATLDYRLARAVLDGREVLGVVSPFIDVREPVAGSAEERRLTATEAFARGSVIDAWMGNTDRILNRGNLWVQGQGPASAMIFGDFDQSFRDGVEVLGVPKLPLSFHGGGVDRAAAAKARAEITALSDRQIRRLVDAALSRSAGFGAEARDYFARVLIRNRDDLRRPEALGAADGLRVRLSVEQASALAEAALAAPEEGGDDLKDVVYLWDKPELVAPTRALLTRLVADKRAGRPQAVELPPEQLALLPVLMNLVYVRLTPERAIRAGIGYYP